MTWGPHPTVRMFFYGTLKRGGQYHDLCRGGTLVSGRAEVDGLLYDLPEGYPALLVPPGKVLAVGSDDYLRDARDALVVSQRALPMPDGASVHGEVYEFGDPVRRLPILDTLEGFDPADPSSPYRRVLVPVRADDADAVTAWTYAAQSPRGTPLPGGNWPP